MNCEEIEALKHAYADRELDLVRTTEIEHHLSDCRACSQAYENIRALSSALKSSDLYFKAPAHLRRRIRASLPNEARSSSSQPFGWCLQPHSLGLLPMNALPRKSLPIMCGH